MSMCLNYRVYRGPTEKEFRNGFEELVCGLGGRVRWNEGDHGLRMSHLDRTHAIQIDYMHSPEGKQRITNVVMDLPVDALGIAPPVDYWLCKQLGKILDVPWFELRIQNSALWDYSFYHGDENLDNFSTLPEYWDDDPQGFAEWRGRPNIVANAWGIPVERIAKYLAPWGKVQHDDETYDTCRRGKAYPDDACEYGDYNQMFDFLKALGAKDPNAGSPGQCHGLDYPPAENVWRNESPP
ncbi:MAG TPA: hypothetical protein VHV55_03300 [Pirellulales bacterium]|nr:hypothetical protein [Pirellulales bacterium]